MHVHFWLCCLELANGRPIFLVWIMADLGSITNCWHVESCARNFVGVGVIHVVWEKPNQCRHQEQNISQKKQQS